MKKIVYSLLAIPILLLGSFFVGYRANEAQATLSTVQSWFVGQVNQSGSATASATTTKIAMTPGTGTTTLNLFPDGNDRVGFDIIVQASSTNTILAMQIQTSADGRDWFPAEVSGLDPGSTTTVGFVHSVAGYWRWQFASSTYLNAGVLYTPNNADTVNTEIVSTTSAARHIEFNMPVAEKARAVFFLVPFPLGGVTTTNANIWVGPSVKQNAQ